MIQAITTGGPLSGAAQACQAVISAMRQCSASYVQKLYNHNLQHYKGTMYTLPQLNPEGCSTFAFWTGSDGILVSKVAYLMQFHGW